jgi:serine phosphatase RsbU (regulator of sigma subunit)
MSMIGSNILNKLITDKGLTDPSEILTQLNSELIFSLKQNKNAGNDGMDIALCVLDFKKKLLKFAGAYRPLYLVRDNLLTEIKGSKFPIGGHQVHNERQFVTNHLNLITGDKFYISTDGYADQFGGLEGKKLTTKKFKEYILSIKDKHIKKQGLLFQNYFDKWKGNNEQLDDVCLIGFEVIES